MSFRFILILGFCVRLMLLLISASHPDVGNHLDWGNKFWQYGPNTFYQQSIWKVSWPNQPIGSIYLFAALSWINQKTFSFFWYLNTQYPIFPSKLIPILEANLHVWLVKIPFLAADILLAYLIYLATNKRKIFSVLFLFNPAVIYNSTVWGQTDSLINLLSLAGIFLVYHRQFLGGTFLFLGSLLFKMSLLIYLPVFIWLLFLYRRDWLKWSIAILLFLALTIVLAIPFSINQNPLTWLSHLYRDLVFNRQGHMLNGNAFNLWLIVFGVSLSRLDNYPIFGFPTSLIAFIIFGLSFLPLASKYVRQESSLKNIWNFLFLTSFASFLFLTNMHERYFYPIMPLLPILLYYRLINFQLFIFLSLTHLLNLYNLWFYPLIPWIKLTLESFNYLLPRLLSSLLIIIYLKFWIKYIQSE